jgi:hypothetical protein
LLRLGDLGISPHHNRVVKGRPETLLLRLDVTSEALLLRDTNTRDMLASFRLGDLGMFYIPQPGLLRPRHHHTSEMSLFLRDVLIPGRSFLRWAEQTSET